MFNFAELIPIVALSIPIVAIWTRHQRKMAELQVKATAEKAAQYATSNAELEERVRVLERIITDGGYDTALQIEALRDTRDGDALRKSERDTSVN
ncbi:MULTISPECIES: hypothetical protein [Novosphingobium]|uniref:Phage shock protein B n=1 Tax=Novosphingobium pentaromativorans US6-1 TaxID=1088721 RepID=G6EEI4_9SPHN|nr:MULTISPECIES: hypothetical protein [Novosphingobium]AIT79428.1 hypothetical protein JI59_06355 [Novosphingobium pentaromativorans US6-1]EHJ60407.1 hypothetical protein NSU_2755 [Novosphingobium pentaromativorans US6-1]GFM27532.1 uncharacterized protein PY1_contig-01-393 [Novosphingobium sp. PY1]CCA92038.1 conserved hypothetical protein [Novosphingobium sp. PP1Y]